MKTPKKTFASKKTPLKAAPQSLIKAPTPRAKREELQTYRDLELGRGLKTAAQRRKLQASGQRRVIGQGSLSQPYLLVETARYRAVRLEMQKRLLVEARRMGLDLPVDALLRQLAPRTEALTYAQLAEEAKQAFDRDQPLAALGRSLTKEERQQFAESQTEPVSLTQPAMLAAGQSAHRALQQVLGQIEQRQSHNPARYQSLWAQVVGPEAAQQSSLEQVDAATHIAWFRCYNSVLSTDLQRRPGLPAKLSQALGVPVRQLKVRF